METAPCPRCSTSRPVDLRFPDALCGGCAALAVCVHGEPVALYDAGLSGGVRLLHRSDEGVCVADGVRVPVTVGGRPFVVVERRFGGVAVLPG